ncbi:MAG TPA: cytochrome P450 [Anaerolineae bacterium]|nr:cytochrome P450 [Anaerolineae bacterium]
MRPLPPELMGGGVRGHLVPLQEDPLAFLRMTQAELGDAMRYRVLVWMVYRFSHPDMAQHILQKNQRNYGKRSIDYRMLRRISGQGLIANEGDSWLQQRRLMQPLFHRRQIASWGEMMVREAARLGERWQEQEGEVVEVHEAMSALTLRIVSEAMFGLALGERGEAFREAFGVVNAYFGSFDPWFVLAPVLPGGRPRAYRRALRQLNEIVYGIIAERRGGGGGGGDMLDLLLTAEDEESGARMDDRQVRDEVITLLIAGHETTANLLSWVFYLLAGEEVVAAKLSREVEQVLGGRLVTIGDWPNLPYLRAVLDETLRLYPPAWFISRTALGEDEVGGYRVPKGAFVSLSPYLTHRRPDFWPEPERFWPERFLEGEGERPRYAYLPFGGGPRQCIGNTFALTEAALILATIWGQGIRFERARVVEPVALITLNPRGGLPLRLKKN